MIELGVKDLTCEPFSKHEQSIKVSKVHSVRLSVDQFVSTTYLIIFVLGCFS